jgi:membrane-associated phospholipid phosphatase
MTSIINNIIDKIAIYAVIIVFFISSLLLHNTSNILIIFIIGYIGNYILNLLLKMILKYPRPIENKHIFDIQMKHNSFLPNKFGLPFGPNRYGMPSGHAQNIMFCIVFVYFALQNKKPYHISNILWVFILFLFLILSAYYKIYNKAHTLFQFLVGMIIGGLMGYFSFYIFEKTIQGKLKIKKDDNAYTRFNHP